jgi:hypothetical protein
MSGALAKQRLQALSQQLVEGIPDEGTFEGLPRIRHVAGDSAGQRVKGKVVVVTGKQQSCARLSTAVADHTRLQAQILQLA